MALTWCAAAFQGSSVPVIFEWEPASAKTPPSPGLWEAPSGHAQRQWEEATPEANRMESPTLSNGVWRHHGRFAGKEHWQKGAKGEFKIYTLASGAATVERLAPRVRIGDCKGDDSLLGTWLKSPDVGDWNEKTLQSFFACTDEVWVTKRQRGGGGYKMTVVPAGSRITRGARRGRKDQWEGQVKAKLDGPRSWKGLQYRFASAIGVRPDVLANHAVPDATADGALYSFSMRAGKTNDKRDAVFIKVRPLEESPKPTDAAGCIDDPEWDGRHGPGTTCSAYRNHHYCHPDGTAGKGWLPLFGPFSDYSVRGADARQACCACGGGQRLYCTDFLEWDGRHGSGTTCSAYRDLKYCNPDGTAGKGWLDSFGPFSKYTVDGFDALQACCACGGGTECTDFPEWDGRHGPGTKCSAYRDYKYCNPDGTAGEGWLDSFGPFSKYTVDGFDALQACCACGGGRRRERRAGAPRDSEGKARQPAGGVQHVAVSEASEEAHTTWTPEEPSAGKTEPALLSTARFMEQHPHALRPHAVDI